MTYKLKFAIIVLIMTVFALLFSNLSPHSDKWLILIGLNIVATILLFKK
jgi:uncharacterized membrane protein YjfL (UPF0719 family)